MSDIPSELHREILLRMPPESLLRFRSVCKSWRRTIDDSSFINSHTQTNKFRPSTLLLRTTTNEICSLSIDSINLSAGEHTVDVKLLKCLSFRGGAPVPPAFLVAACNGLILLQFQSPNIWAIWNPFTADFRQLPRLLDFGAADYPSFGFGYDSASDDYKVVRIDFFRRERVLRTLLYSLRSNTWKMIGDCPIDFYCNADAVFSNGSLHWTSSHHLVSLDLSTEGYRRVALPASPTLPFGSRLDGLDGCLVLSDSIKTECAWVLRNGPVDPEKSPWRKMFSSRERSVIGKFKGCQWLVDYSKSQREIILQQSNKIVMWDVDNYSAKEVTINGPIEFDTSQIFAANLFRFEDVDGGGGDLQVQRRDNCRTRMRWWVTTNDLQCLSPSDCNSVETVRVSDQSGSEIDQTGGGSGSRSESWLWAETETDEEDEEEEIEMETDEEDEEDEDIG